MAESKRESMLFPHSWLKLERAYRHIDEVNFRFSKYMSSKFCRVYTVYKNGYHTFGVEIIKDVPIEISIAVGDAIHNLKAALDYLVSKVVADAGIKDSRVTFPFHQTRENLIASFDKSDPAAKPCPRCGRHSRGGTNAVVRRAAPDLVNLIIDQIKPYIEGETATEFGISLWNLNKYDNINKHKITQVVIRATSVAGIKIVSEKQNAVVDNLNVLLYGQRRFEPVRFAEDLVILDQGQVRADILFPAESPFEGFPVIPTLVQLHKNVSEVIKIFEEKLQRGDNPAGSGNE